MYIYLATNVGCGTTVTSVGWPTIGKKHSFVEENVCSRDLDDLFSLLNINGFKKNFVH